ncbi:hypothetical protein [Emticicia sp. SJ17W-69]|uniref:hypothetical protein n=1 Tax=Emticicia sp. SJ17W-69 TaxID=3421657 RepID=UPI003EC01020
MKFLDEDYFNKLIKKSKIKLEQQFYFSIFQSSNFNIVNTFIIHSVLQSERSILQITTPHNSKFPLYFIPTILPTLLHCIDKNIKAEINLNVNDIVINKNDGRISTIKKIENEQIFILPLGTTKRVILKNINDYILLSSKYSDKLEEVRFNQTRVQKFENRMFQLYKQFEAILTQISIKDNCLPLKQPTKTIIVASKNDILNKIPDYIPFIYMNKSGQIYPDSPFDPILIVVNDFGTIKDHFISHDIPIDTIIFIGDNKYLQSISAISKSYRQKKFNYCIFIGTQDMESDENFEVLKWKWTLPELKLFENNNYQNIELETILHSDLSLEIANFTTFVTQKEFQYNNLINLKSLLKYIRKIYPITAFNNENRIRARANEILSAFEKEAEEVFQDEYYNIEIPYKDDFEKLRNIYKKIIILIKTTNQKANYFKNNEAFDFIVVPRSIKSDCEREIQKCMQLEDKQQGIKVNNLQNLSHLFNQPKSEQPYSGLKQTKVITLKEYTNREADDKKYLFLSLFGNGIYPDVLLQKILFSNLQTKILCYNEEAKSLNYYLHNFKKRDEIDLRSIQREKICGLHYPETQQINIENIDDWIKYLIDTENFNFSKREEIFYEITFEEETKKIKERESKNVYVEGYEEYHKEVNQLIKGDKVRIYQNPDKETLHDIIKITDEKELFSRVDYYSLLWKNSLREYFTSKGFGYLIDNLYDEVKLNGLTVDKNRLENWLKLDNKTKFPMKKLDLVAIIKTVNNIELNQNIKDILAIKTEYSGRIIKAGVELSEEINTYILTNEKGKMLDWLGDNQIKEIIQVGAPMRTIKSIKILEEIID